MVADALEYQLVLWSILLFERRMSDPAKLLVGVVEYRASQASQLLWGHLVIAELALMLPKGSLNVDVRRCTRQRLYLRKPAIPCWPRQPYVVCEEDVRCWRAPAGWVLC